MVIPNLRLQRRKYLRKRLCDENMRISKSWCAFIPQNTKSYDLGNQNRILPITIQFFLNLLKIRFCLSSLLVHRIFSHLCCHCHRMCLVIRAIMRRTIGRKENHIFRFILLEIFHIIEISLKFDSKLHQNLTLGLGLGNCLISILKNILNRDGIVHADLIDKKIDLMNLPKQSTKSCGIILIRIILCLFHKSIVSFSDRRYLILNQFDLILRRRNQEILLNGIGSLLSFLIFRIQLHQPGSKILLSLSSFPDFYQNIGNRFL